MMTDEEWTARWEASMLFHYGLNYKDTVTHASWLKHWREKCPNPAAAVHAYMKEFPWLRK